MIIIVSLYYILIHYHSSKKNHFTFSKMCNQIRKQRKDMD
jgi:hypothetical protein